MHLLKRGWRVSTTLSLFVAIILGIARCVVGPLPNQPPLAVLTANPTSGDAPLTVIFDISGSSDPDGEIVSFILTFGDGTSASGSDVTKLISHTYGDDGSYTATLIVTDNDGATGQAMVTITVSNPGPTASFTYSPKYPKPNETITFDASGSVDPASVDVTAQSIVDYAWDFGDGNTGAGKITTHAYESEGTYTVTLTVTDDDGAQASATKEITVASEVSWTQTTQEDWNQGSFSNTTADERPGDVVLARGTSPSIVWERRFDNGGGSSGDQANGVAVDSEDNVIVTGLSFPFGIYTIKYDSDGSQLWQRSGGGGAGEGVAVDSQDNIAVTGQWSNYYTVKYDLNGKQIWERSFNWGCPPQCGCCDHAYAVATDSSDNVIITGKEADGHFLTIKYSPNGNEIWIRVRSIGYSGGTYQGAWGVAVDSHDNIIVTGQEASPARIRTIKYSPDGTILWDKSYIEGEASVARGVAVDSDDNVVVVGASYVPYGVFSDFLIVKYDADGNILWTKRHDKGGDEWAYGVAIDSLDNIVVTGFGGGYESYLRDYYTAKFNSAGVMVWDTVFATGVRDEAHAVAVDNSDDIIVTGYTGNVTGDWYTIKYGEGRFSSGAYTSQIHQFSSTVSFDEFRADATLNAQSIEATVEVSDDNFASVKDSISFALADGTASYDISSLANAQYVRVRFDFTTTDVSVTPVLHEFTITGKRK